MNLVILNVFEKPIDAHLLRSKLESEGIECFIHDENLIQLNPFYNVLLGGIKLKVKEEDFTRAQGIMNELEATPYTDEDDEILRCPKCQSHKIYSGFRTIKSAKGILSMIISLILYVFPFYINSVYRCKDCGHEFKKH